MNEPYNEFADTIEIVNKLPDRGFLILHSKMTGLNTNDLKALVAKIDLLTRQRDAAVGTFKMIKLLTTTTMLATPNMNNAKLVLNGFELIDGYAQSALDSIEGMEWWIE